MVKILQPAWGNVKSSENMEHLVTVFRRFRTGMKKNVLELWKKFSAAVY